MLFNDVFVTERRLTAEGALDHPWLHKEVAELTSVDLTYGVTEMRRFTARRNFRAGVKAVLAVNKLKKLGERFRLSNSSLSSYSSADLSPIPTPTCSASISHCNKNSSNSNFVQLDGNEKDAILVPILEDPEMEETERSEADAVTTPLLIESTYSLEHPNEVDEKQGTSAVSLTGEGPSGTIEILDLAASPPRLLDPSAIGISEEEGNNTVRTLSRKTRRGEQEGEDYEDIDSDHDAVKVPPAKKAKKNVLKENSVLNFCAIL